MSEIEDIASVHLGSALARAAEKQLLVGSIS